MRSETALALANMLESLRLEIRAASRRRDEDNEDASRFEYEAEKHSWRGILSLEEIVGQEE